MPFISKYKKINLKGYNKIKSEIENCVVGGIVYRYKDEVFLVFIGIRVFNNF